MIKFSEKESTDRKVLRMKLQLELEFEVQDKILEVAQLYNELTTSDLQGVAMVKAKDIVAGVVKLVKDGKL